MTVDPLTFDPIPYIHWTITIISTISVIILGWLKFLKGNSDKELAESMILKDQVVKLNTEMELVKQAKINAIDLKSFNGLATTVAILEERIANETRLLEKLEDKIDKLIEQLG